MFICFFLSVCVCVCVCVGVGLHCVAQVGLRFLSSRNPSGLREVAHHLRVFPALLEDLSSIHSTYTGISQEPGTPIPEDLMPSSAS